MTDDKTSPKTDAQRQAKRRKVALEKKLFRRDYYQTEEEHAKIREFIKSISK